MYGLSSTSSSTTSSSSIVIIIITTITYLASKYVTKCARRDVVHAYLN